MTRDTGFSPRVRALIHDRGNGLCEICGAAEIEQIHHRRPRGMGGTRRASTNQAANGLGVCSVHHDVAEGQSVTDRFMRRIHGSRERSERYGWLISKHTAAEPRTVPVRLVYGWVLLDNDGGITPAPENEQEAS